jgi:flagellar basal-body rod protein FlgC
MQAMEISRTGLEVEWRRLEVIAENLANAGTTRTESGGPYQAKRLLTGPRADFAAQLATRGGTGTVPGGVAVLGVDSVNLPPRMVHEPAHPHADKDGYVAYPGVDHAGEMSLMVKTSRAYEANIVAMNVARQMYMKAMELGRGQ